MYFMRNYCAVLLLLAICVYAEQSPPGTSERPILTATEAALYTKAAYLKDWSPSSISTSHADYLVGSGGYATIQAAVNAAISAGGSQRKYIKVTPGTYKEVVYIPSTNVPLTVFGGGNAPADTVISLQLPAQTTPSQYVDIVNSGGSHFKSGDPAYNMYSSCAKKSSIIGTSCSAVFWVKANNVEISQLTIYNTANSTGDNQAVALETEGDKIHVDNVRLLGHQDTLCSGSSGSTVARSYLSNTYIEGDIDFIFGAGTAVFEKCTFKAKSDRRQDIAVIFAPSTTPSNAYGFLVTQSTITGDSLWATSKKVYLARAWDMGVPSASAYVPGTSPNGQLVIRDSTINGVIPNSAPYNTATSGRKYSGNPSASRNLNNNSFNRFWEYNNNGKGS